MSGRRHLLIAFFCVLACVHAWAWGCTGHEVGALIALQNLRPEVASQVESLLDSQNHTYPGRYCTDISLDPIAYYATWADDYRSGHPEMGAWHYRDIRLYLSSASEGQFCDGGGVIQALNDQLAILRDFLQHKTSETGVKAGSYTPNLHGVWDIEIVVYIGGITTRTQASVQAIAAKIASNQATVIHQAASEPVDFIKWGLEAHSVAKKDPYAKLPRKIAVAKTAEPVALCSDRNTSEDLAKKHESIPTTYLHAVGGDVELQLARAGGRLAAVLNSAWPGNP